MNGGPTVRRLHRERQSRLLRMQSRSRRTARGSESGRLDEMPGYPPGAKLTEIDAFVHEYLIPYIRGVSQCESSSREYTWTDDDRSDKIRLPQFEPNLAFLGPRWCSSSRSAATPETD
jgi:hypothetical protein